MTLHRFIVCGLGREEPTCGAEYNLLLVKFGLDSSIAGHIESDKL